MLDPIVGTEYLPNVHIDKVIYFDRETDSDISVSFSMFDILGRQGWSLNESFIKHLQIKCYVVWDKTLMQEINGGLRPIMSLPEGASLVSFALTIPFMSIISSFDKEEKRGKEYKKFTGLTKFTIPRYTTDLQVYIVSAIDINTLKDNMGLNLKYTDSPSYLGSIKSEVLKKDGEYITTSLLLKKENTGEIWSGPAHEHSSLPAGKVMEGSFHVATDHSILDVEVHRNVGKVEFPGLEFANPDAEELYEMNRVNTNNYNRPETRLADHYQMEFVEDEQRNLSNTVIIELENMLLGESRAAKLMHRNHPEMLREIAANVNINGFQVFRHLMSKKTSVNRMGIRFSPAILGQRQMVAKSNNNFRRIKERTLYQISPREVFSVNPKKVKKAKGKTVFNGKEITSDILNDAKKIGKISQLNLSMPANFRAINFFDYEVKDAKSGNYKYSMKITFKDEPLLYCKKVLKDLLECSNKISNLISVLHKKQALSGDNFTTSFLKEFYSQYDVSVNTDGTVNGTLMTQPLKDSYLVKSFQKLKEVERLLGRRRSPFNSNPLNLFRSDIDKLNSYSAYYNRLIYHFKKAYDLSDGVGFERAKTGNRKERGVIEKTIVMKQTYKRKLLKPILINFIKSEEILDSVPKIDMRYFQSRANIETKKFFPSNINANSKLLSNLSSDIKEKFTNIERDKFINFSPAKISFGSKKINTTQVNPVSFDADFFNTLRVVKAALKVNEAVQEEEDQPDTSKPIDRYTDSNKFFGDLNFFNRSIVSQLNRRPIAVKKIRRRMRLLDTKVLKANQRKISLDKFDVSKSTNFIAKKLEAGEDIPIQLKALSLLKTPMTTLNMDAVDFDPLSNPQTQEVIMQNYLNIGKVEALTGFEIKDNKVIMNKPIYKTIDSKTVSSMQEKNTICRIVQRKIQDAEVEDTGVNIPDKVFLIENTTKMQGGPMVVNSTATQYYRDTPGAIKAGPKGLSANFLAGDYVIAAQDPKEVLRQAQELVEKTSTEQTQESETDASPPEQDQTDTVLPEEDEMQAISSEEVHENDAYLIDFSSAIVFQNKSNINVITDMLEQSEPVTSSPTATPTQPDTTRPTPSLPTGGY